MSIKGIYDIHCHIVPGVDDGATDIGETVKLLRMEYEQGVRTVITTPHFRFRMFETPAEKVREQFRLVEKAASEISPDLHVYLGCEFHANMEMLPMLREQKVMTMAGSRYVLTEFSHNSEESYIRERLGALLSGGYKPIMFKLDFDPRVIGNKILPDGTKKTGIGEFIRKTSLDEFPQFWNVLNGTMSLVGTRPILQDELRQYELHHRARIAIKPGITGMWQVSGRSDITDFEEVVRLDTEYISNWSFSLDIKILFKTVIMVLKREGSV